MKWLSKCMLAGALFGVACTGFAKDIADDMVGTADALKKWGGNAAVEFLPDGGYKGKAAVRIVAGADKKGKMIGQSLKADEVKGKKIEFSAKVKAENVAPGSKSWLGVKFMISIKTAEGKQSWIETFPANLRNGTYDWQEIKTTANVPADAVTVSVSMGIQESEGTVLFSDVEVELED